LGLTLPISPFRGLVFLLSEIAIDYHFFTLFGTYLVPQL